MRITYIHQHFNLPDQPGGSRPYEFARRLAREGHIVTVIAGGKSRTSQSIDGFRLERVASPYKNYMPFRERVVSFLRFAFASSKLTFKIPADVVFASSTPLTTAIPALIVHVGKRVPMVFEVRDLWPTLPIELGVIKNPFLIAMAQALEKTAYKNSRAIIALSPWMEAGVKQVVPSAVTAMIPNASDFETFDFDARQRETIRDALGWSGKTVLVYAGSFGESYGLDWLVRLAGKLDDSFKVVAYGEGASTPKLRALARELGLDADEILPGRLPKREIAKRIAASDATISCLSGADVLQHNSLNKVFDSLAAGRPILFNHGGWLCELAEDYEAGLRLSLDIERAAAQIGEAKDSGGFVVMCDGATKLGREHFDREKLFAQFHQVLLGIPSGE